MLLRQKGNALTMTSGTFIEQARDPTSDKPSSLMRGPLPPPPGPGVTPRKIGWGCAARFPKPLPYLRYSPPYLWPDQKFKTLFVTWPLNQNPVSDLCYNREFKQIATAGADTAAGSKFPPKWDTAHVRWLHPAVAWNLTTRVGMFYRSGKDCLS